MHDIVEVIVLVLFGIGIAIWVYVARGEMSESEKDRLLEPDSEPMLWAPPETPSDRKPPDQKEG